MTLCQNYLGFYFFKYFSHVNSSKPLHVFILFPAITLKRNYALSEILNFFCPYFHPRILLNALSYFFQILIFIYKEHISNSVVPPNNTSKVVLVILLPLTSVKGSIILAEHVTLK